MTLAERVAAQVRRRAPEAAADPATYSPYRPGRADRARELLLRVVGRAGGDDPVARAARQAEVDALWPGLERTHALLADDRSRDVLAAVLARHVHGPARVALPVSRAAWTAACDAMAARAEGAPRPTPAGAAVRRLRWSGLGGEVRLWGDPLQVVPLVHFGQYAVPPVRGVIVDGGGGGRRRRCTSPTATRRHHASSPSSWIRPTRRCGRRTSRRTRGLPTRCSCTAPLCGRGAGRRWPTPPNAGASTIGTPSDGRAPTTTVDEAVEGPVGLVKLDVEGAELAALEGARVTLERDRPALAISVYHRLEHLVTIPAWVDAVGLGHRLTLGHHTPWAAETVLVATP